jgi:hypothetical protein
MQDRIALETPENLPIHERDLLDIGQVLLATKNLLKPCRKRWSGKLGNGEIPLFPSLHVRPDRGGESSPPDVVLLDILIHILPAPMQFDAVVHGNDL